MFLEQYYKEIQLYRRREQLLDILDGFARDAFYDKEYAMKKYDPKMVML
jgi:hypothetical protein